MSIRHVANVLDHVHGISHGAKLLLLCLADYADENGRCWPSFQSMASRSDMSRRHVIRTMAELAEAGLIVRVEERPYKPTVYELRIPTSDTHVTSKRKSSDAHVTSDTEDTSDAHVTTLVTPTSLPSDTHVTSTSDIAMSPNPPIRTVIEPPMNHQGERAKRAHPLPDDFAVTQEMRDWAWENGFSDDEVRRETLKFESYWRGNGKPKVRWDQSWRNWLLNSRDRYGQNGRASPATPVAKTQENGRRLLERIQNSTQEIAER